MKTIEIIILVVMAEMITRSKLLLIRDVYVIFSNNGSST